MTALPHLDSLTDDWDTDLTPRFLVEPPDGRRDMPEVARQRLFLNRLHMLAPSVMAFATPNAGKRNPALAKREGIRAGVFDVRLVWNRGQADVEFKGYDARGQAGKLSAAQIGWGNAMVERGHHVACFFDPDAALRWVHSLGAPFMVPPEGV